ncbi:PAS domain S-box protein [Methanoregula sp.]|uniref:PAS domain S-box protein n=1 Tax=Methanoregula sp. TaxID=2052170 RepID=UPI003563E85C
MDNGKKTNTLHILLLEDDTAHQDLILRAFREDPEPFRLSLAGTIRNAREIIGHDPPDLIISDWILPDGKGLDILPRTDGRVTIPLIIMTSYGDERLAVEIMKSGAIDYVVKSATVFKDLPHIVRHGLRDWDNIRQRKQAETAALESQKRLADILNFLPDAMLAIDNKGRVIAWNDAIERMTGVSAGEMLGKGDYAYSLPFYGERRPILIDLLRSEHPEIEKKYDYVHRDCDRLTTEVFSPVLFEGKGAYLWGTATPLYDADRNRIGAIEVIRDITERKLAEETLKKREATLEILLNAPHDTIALLDRQGRIININESGARRLGRTVPEVLGCPVYDLLPSDLARARKGFIDRVFATGEPACFEDERNGMCLHHEVYPVFGSDHVTIEQVAIFTRDITDQKKTKRALEKSESRFRHVSDLISDFAFSCLRPETGTFSIDWVSGAVTRITGFSDTEILSMGCWRGIVAEEYQPVFDAEIAGLLPGRSSRCELRIRAKDGTEKWLVCFAECIPDPANPQNHRLYGGCQDITARKNAELALQESEIRFRDLFNNMNAGVIIYEIMPDGSDFIIRDLNKAVETIEQVKKEEIVGKSILQVFPGVREFGLFDVLLWVARTGIAESHPVSRYQDNRIAGWRENYVYKLPSGEIVALYEDVTEKKQAEIALRAARKWLGIALRAAKAGTWDWDIPAGTRIWSPEYFELFGLIPGTPASFETWMEAVHPDDREPAQAKIDQSIRDHTPLWSEYRIILSGGKVRWIGAAGNTVYNDAGEPLRMSGICIDISERKVIEEKLRESEERYRALLSSGGIGVGYWSPDGTLLFLNEISLNRLKGTAEEFIGKNIRELFGADAEKYLERMRIAAASADPMEYEDYISLPVGEGWYLSIYNRITGPDGNVKGIQVQSMDISERKQAEEIRKSYELRLDSAMEIGSMAWWEMDLPDGAVRFDDRKATMLGYAPAQFRHYTDFTSLLHPEDLEPAMQAMRDHLEGRESRYHLDYRIRTAAGDYRWFRDVGGITKRHPDGTPATVTGIIIDITANKLAEERLRTTETRFRALIQNSSDIIRILDPDGRIAYESPSSERILGYPREYMINRDPLEFIHPEDLGRVKADLQDVIDKKNPGTPTEFRIRKADGEYIWVDSVGINLQEVPGVNGIVITTRPIQIRKEAEQALTDSEERLRLALEGAGAAYWDWNLITGKAVFSDRFSTMLGYQPGDFPATYDGWTALIHPEDRARVLPDLIRQIQEKYPICEIEYRLRSKDGAWIWVLGRGKIAETDPAGNAVRLTGVNIDITNRRLMESEIRSLNTVLEQRVKDRTEALSLANTALAAENVQRITAEKKLQASYDEKVMLLKEIHHRVKNNLQIIISLLNLQSRYITDEQTLAAIRESQNRIKAMALVHEKLYRAEDISRIDLRDYLAYLGAGLFKSYDAASRGIRLSVEIKDISVDIDAALPLGLIINELISNSLKYAFPEGKSGSIFIRVTRDGRALTVLFRDDGIGIPQELDWRNTLSLGLRLVNTLVDQLNGTIELDRTSGTQFTFIINEKESRGPE